MKNKNEFSLSGVNRTGCIFCLYGIQFDKEPNRIQSLKITHPKLYNYCINDLGVGKVLNKMNINY
jgi:hypothetical protein